MVVIMRVSAYLGYIFPLFNSFDMAENSPFENIQPDWTQALLSVLWCVGNNNKIQTTKVRYWDLKVASDASKQLHLLELCFIDCDLRITPTFSMVKRQAE